MLTLLTVFPIAGSLQEMPAAQPEAVQGSAARGEDLFTGRTGFVNQGPACVSCHSIAGLSFPNGGTLGPDLTRTYRKLGPRGTPTAMQTLFFRVMTPIYSSHSLTAQEQADLLAFLKQAESQPLPQGDTQIVIFAALLVGAALVGLTGLLWKDRVKSVRRALVSRATRQGAPL